MVYYQYNPELDFVAVRYVNEVTASEVIEGLNNISDDPALPKDVKVVIISEGVIPLIAESELDDIILVMTKTLNRFNSFRIAFVQNDPKNAALALLFSSRLHQRTNYHQEVFASIAAACEWIINQTPSKGNIEDQRKETLKFLSLIHAING